MSDKDSGQEFSEEESDWYDLHMAVPGRQDITEYAKELGFYSERMEIQWRDLI